MATTNSKKENITPENQLFLRNFISHFIHPTEEEWNDFLNAVEYEHF